MTGFIDSETKPAAHGFRSACAKCPAAHERVVLPGNGTRDLLARISPRVVVTPPVICRRRAGPVTFAIPR